MQLSEFQFLEDDFNEIMEIQSGCEEPIVQIRSGQPKWCSKQERIQSFWLRMANKYGFTPFTEKTEVPGRDARYFLAEKI